MLIILFLEKTNYQRSILHHYFSFQKNNIFLNYYVFLCKIIFDFN